MWLLCAEPAPRVTLPHHVPQQQHWLGLVCSTVAPPATSDTMLVSEVWLWWTTLAARVYKVTPLNHLPTPLWQTEKKWELTLGVMFEPPMKSVATTLQVCVITTSKALQGWRGNGSEWPLTVLGHTQPWEGKEMLSGPPVPQSTSQSPNSSHILCSAGALEILPCDFKWSQDDAFKGTAGTAYVWESGVGGNRRKKMQAGKKHWYKGGCSVLQPHFLHLWSPCPSVQDSEKHYHRDRQNEFIFQTRQFNLHCRMFLLLVTSYHYDLFYGLNNMNMILSLEQVIESSWRLAAQKILSYHNNKATFYLTKVFSASIQSVHA